MPASAEKVMPKPYYEYHLFFCTNQREEGKTCCANHGSQAMRDYAKARIKSMGLAGKGRVRVNTAGCMDRCEEGPVLVVYPEGTWYTYVDQEDIDEIIDEHVVHGRPVERLKI
jgi:(2Fe-2S) ferredoxin